jgi:hypothetical protein
VDEPEADRRLALRQLPGELGGQPAGVARPDLPTLSRTYPLAETGQAAYDVHRNLHSGKVGVLCLAPEEGLGVEDSAQEMRARHLPAINRFRDR